MVLGQRAVAKHLLQSKLLAVTLQVYTLCMEQLSPELIPPINEAVIADAPTTAEGQNRSRVWFFSILGSCLVILLVLGVNYYLTTTTTAPEPSPLSEVSTSTIAVESDIHTYALSPYFSFTYPDNFSLGDEISDTFVMVKADAAADASPALFLRVERSYVGDEQIYNSEKELILSEVKYHAGSTAESLNPENNTILETETADTAYQFEIISPENPGVIMTYRVYPLMDNVKYPVAGNDAKAVQFLWLNYEKANEQLLAPILQSLQVKTLSS